MPRPARHPRQIHRVREGILDAAIGVFASKGYAAATMQEIAREAGYTAPSLYNYFAGKRQIFEALVDRLDDEFVGVFAEPMPARLGFEQRIELLVRRQLELARRRRGSFKIFHALSGGAGAIPSARAARRHAEGFRTYMARFAAWMRTAAASDGIALDERRAEELAFSLWGLENAFQARSAGRGGGDKDVQALLRMFLYGALGANPIGRRGLRSAPGRLDKSGPGASRHPTSGRA